MGALVLPAGWLGVLESPAGELGASVGLLGSVVCSVRTPRSKPQITLPPLTVGLPGRCLNSPEASREEVPVMLPSQDMFCVCSGLTGSYS